MEFKNHCCACQTFYSDPGSLTEEASRDTAEACIMFYIHPWRFHLLFIADIEVHRLFVKFPSPVAHHLLQNQS